MSKPKILIVCVRSPRKDRFHRWKWEEVGTVIDIDGYEQNYIDKICQWCHYSYVDVIEWKEK
jgi:hypothetical protein